MALQTSGAISIMDIVTEFGGTIPHGLSEYYGVATGIPSSGSIDISDFYGASAATSVTLTFSVGEDAAASPTSGTYVQRRVGYGLAGANDFYYPESVTGYSSGFGTCTNSTSVFSGATVSQITAEKYPNTTTYAEWIQFAVKDGPNLQSAFSNLVFTYINIAGYSQSTTLSSSSSQFYTKSSNRLSTTVRTWAWSDEISTAANGYNYDAGSLAANMFTSADVALATGATTNFNVTVNF